ncbi:MAG: winged helix-turn-helix transcriptional regulator [Dehalococcoidia bacterium]|nr:winged helix-turn-helix transcriptional regulator [Dehalococcoidia bacterium]
MSSLIPAIQMFHYRWSVPTVARIYRDGPQRVPQLQQAFNAARDTLTDTVRRLERAGVILRSPAPRGALCSLTPAGEAVGSACIDAVDAVVAMDLVQLALKKWPMLVLVAAGRGASRFNQLRAELPGITPRALTLALKDLQAAGLIERTVEHTYPPSSLYRLTPRGLELFPVMDRLCRAAEAAVAL